MIYVESYLVEQPRLDHQIAENYSLLGVQFDHELFLEWNDRRFGPYHPSGGPIPLHRYRKHRRSRREARADTVGDLGRLRDEAEGGPFLLRMNMSAGHGGSAARFERLKERAADYAFALDVLGLSEAEPDRGL